MKNNDFMKDCFYKALILLLKENELEKIQVNQICLLAGYNRSTFYRNYNSKLDIICDKFNRMILSYQEGISKLKLDTIDRIQFLLKLIKEHSEIFLLMHHVNLDFKMYLMFKKIFDNKSDDLYHLEFIALGTYGIIMKWVLGGLKEETLFIANKISLNLKNKKEDLLI